MNFIKARWKEILLVIFIIFSLNKCTVACNRDSKIKKQDIEIAQKDSVIKVQGDSLNIMNIRWNDAQQSQSTYQGIAMGNQQELVSQISSLESEIQNLNSTISSLKSENNKLKQEIRKLKDR